MAKSKITAERLKALVVYEPETGQFRWRIGRPGCRAGDVAGSKERNGYIRLNLDGRKVSAHRLAWLYVHGRFPEYEIDHINGDRSDNAIANLRDVSHEHNMQNRAGANRGSKSGLLGVGLNTRSARAPWIAKIKVGGRAIALGAYATPEEAHSAYLAAKSRLHVGSLI